MNQEIQKIQKILLAIYALKSSIEEARHQCSTPIDDIKLDYKTFDEFYLATLKDMSEYVSQESNSAKLAWGILATLSSMKKILLNKEFRRNEVIKQIETFENNFFDELSRVQKVMIKQKEKIENGNN